MKLTKPQRELLSLLDDGPRVDISDERVGRALERRGLVFHFYESGGGQLSAVWTITDAGRAALAAPEGGSADG